MCSPTTPLWSRTFRFALVVLFILLTQTSAPAYSVLTHEATIDAAWDASIKPLLRAKYPNITAAALEDARAYAYGGCVIHDLGYYPFGAKFFSNLLHYVRSGDFVAALLRDAQDVDEYAFALGALGHYASDNNGHPIATNHVVPIMYPKLRAKFGDAIAYDQAPKQHILVEFSFDVVQVAGGAYAPEAFHRFIGFKVAEPLLERAFQETYGLDMGDQFMDRSLAIGTYRYSVGKAIPEMTKAAWKSKREEIERLTPGVTEASYVFNLSRQEYEQQFGKDYAKPKGFAKVIGWLYHLIPKIGPFRALAFKVPTPEAEQLFLESFERTKQRYAQELNALKGGRPQFANINLDLGRAAPKGDYPLADETYDELIKKLAEHKQTVPAALTADLARHYGTADPRVAALKP
jgi:hypothetical protein